MTCYMSGALIFSEIQTLQVISQRSNQIRCYMTSVVKHLLMLTMRCHVTCRCPQLEEGHTGRLERTEDLWLRVRKDHAPRLARLSLESRSFRDVLLHGESSK